VKVLVVDQDPDQLDNLSVGLRFGWPNWTVLTARDGREGLRLFVEHSPRLVLVDAAAPQLQGFDLLREIRRLSQVPVIVLSTLRTELDHVRALDLGADDYIIKPVDMLTLLARIRAILRRTDPGRHNTSPPQEAIRAGDLRLDPLNQQVWVADRHVPLTPAEFRLLDLLVRNPNRLILNGTICEAVWGVGWNATRNDLKALVHRLRLKLGDSSREPKYIENRRAIGYRFIGQHPDPYPG
jgi:DNA-binding response OmpR family regulator